MNDNLEKIFLGPRMISYAQNLEDVILQRALRNVLNGFYIDLGAADPIIDSVTKHFYDTGWSGINVEPNPIYFEALEKFRPRDINIDNIASNFVGLQDLYAFDHAAFSTTQKEVAATHGANNHIFKIQRIESTTLNVIFEKIVQGREVHFLKIDVEGAEKKVLEGIDLRKFRPWILVIEATLPNTKMENFHEWEPLVTEFSYELVYRDGLNRFYLAKELFHLKSFFDLPPNVFDNFEQYYEYRQVDLDRLRNENLELRESLKKYQVRSKFNRNRKFQIYDKPE